MPTPKPQALIYSAWKSSCISPCQHGGIFHAVVEHLPPQSAWRPLVASPSHPSPALAPCPASQVTGSPVTPVWRTAVQAPRAHRYGRWAEAVQRASGLRVLGWLPQWACQLPFPPTLPLSPVLLSRLSLPPGQSTFVSLNTTGFLFVKFS